MKAIHKNKSKNSILLIEDDLAVVDVYKTAFEVAGIGLEVINLGKKALERLKNIQEGRGERPALVLLDLMLPDINGLELLFNIRNHSVTKDMKVFILSNYSSDALLNINYIKPDKFIVKSNITPSQLVQLVKDNI